MARKRPWHISRYYTEICLEGHSKITKPLVQDSPCAGRDSDQEPPEALPPEPTGINYCQTLVALCFNNAGRYSLYFWGGINFQVLSPELTNMYVEAFFGTSPYTNNLVVASTRRLWISLTKQNGLHTPTFHFYSGDTQFESRSGYRLS